MIIARDHLLNTSISKNTSYKKEIKLDKITEIFGEPAYTSDKDLQRIGIADQNISEDYLNSMILVISQIIANLDIDAVLHPDYLKTIRHILVTMNKDEKLIFCKYYAYHIVNFESKELDYFQFLFPKLPLPIDAISKMTGLESLNIHNLKLSIKEDDLRKIRHLKHLKFYLSALNNADIKLILNTFDHLESHSIYGNDQAINFEKIDFEGNVYNRLKNLKVNNCGIKQAGLVTIGNIMPSLESLTIHENECLELGKYSFDLMKKLKELNFTYPGRDYPKSLLDHICAGRGKDNELKINAISSEFYSLTLKELLKGTLRPNPLSTTCLEVTGVNMTDETIISDPYSLNNGTERYLSFNDTQVAISNNGTFLDLLQNDSTLTPTVLNEED